MIKLGVTIAAGACLFATAAAAGPCETQGETSSRPVSLDYKKDPTGYTVWAFALDRALTEPVLASAREEAGCTRAQFRAAGEAYTLGGENGQRLLRRAIPASPDKPVLVLVPVQNMTGAFGPGFGGARQVSGPTYALVAVDASAATAVRLYSKIPTDEVLVRDLTRVIETGGQPFARKARPDGEMAIVLSPTVD
jgi:hypothetical protein